MIDNQRIRVTDAWQSVQQVPVLTEHAVHVWLVEVPDPEAGRATPPDTDTDHVGRGGTALQPYAALLSEDEAGRARTLAEPALSRYVVTRATLRTRLAAYLGCPAPDVCFDYGEMGKPHLRTEGRLHFSVAHSGGIALLAFTRGEPLGVDVERIRPVRRRNRVARRVFAQTTAAALERLPAPVREDAFIWAWTQREAYVKAIGSGLLRSPDPLPFVWPPAEYRSAGWHVVPLPITDAYRGCLVAHSAARRVHLLTSP